MAYVGNPLDDLADLFEDPEFRDAPQEEREKAVEFAIGQSMPFLQSQPDWPQRAKEYHREFTGIAAWARQQVEQAETPWEATKRYAGHAGQAVLDSAAVLGTAAYDVLPVGRQGLKQPLEGVGAGLGSNVAQLGDSADTMAKKALSPTNEAIAAELTKLRADIDAAKFPLDTADKFSAWVKGRADVLQGKTRAYYRAMEDDDTWSDEAVKGAARESRIDENPEHLSLLTAYVQTRSPRAWEALRKSLLTTPSRRAMDAEAQAQIVATDSAQDINVLAGDKPDDPAGAGARYVGEAGDPFELAGTVIVPLKGAKAVAKGVKASQRAVHAAAGLGAEVASELGSHAMDDPHATASERIATAKQALAGAVGLAGTGAVLGKARELYRTKSADAPSPEVTAASLGPAFHEDFSPEQEQALLADVQGQSPAPSLPDEGPSSPLIPQLPDDSAAQTAQSSPLRDAFDAGLRALADDGAGLATEADLAAIPRSPPTPVDPLGTVLEPPEQLQAQRHRVAAGRKPAMLIPGATAADLADEFLPAEGEAIVATDTEAGVVLHGPQLEPQAVQEAVASGRTGTLLGLGLNTKPADATHTVVQRGPDGTVIAEAAASVDTDAQVVEALTAQRIEGDTIEREGLNETLKRRVNTHLNKVPGVDDEFERSLAERERIRALSFAELQRENSQNFEQAIYNALISRQDMERAILFIKKAIPGARHLDTLEGLSEYASKERVFPTLLKAFHRSLEPLSPKWQRALDKWRASQRLPAGQKPISSSPPAYEDFVAEPILSGAPSPQEISQAHAHARHTLGELESRARSLGASIERESAAVAPSDAVGPSNARPGGPQASPLRVEMRPNGAIVLKIDHARALEGRWNTSRHRAPALASGMEQAAFEEQLHVATLAGLREHWVKLPKRGRPAFDAFVRQRFAAIIGDMRAAIDRRPAKEQQALKSALLDSYRLYFDPQGQHYATAQDFYQALGSDQGLEHIRGGQTNWLMEFARQLVQIQRQDIITETAAASVLARLKQWVKTALARLKAAYSATRAGQLGESFRQLIAETEAVLDGKPLEPVQLSGHRGEGQAFAAAGWTEMKSEVKAVLKRQREFTPFKRVINGWSARMQRTALATERLKKGIERRVPNKLRREAVTNFLQAGGDIATLKQWEAASSGRLAEGYRLAQSLTPDEQALAQEIRGFYDTAGALATSQGILRSWVQDYVNKVWKDRFFIAKLTRTFRFGRRAMHNNFFEGEQQGLVPATKDIAALMGIYLSELHRTIATRHMIRDLTQQTASDGRPLAAPLGGTVHKIDPADPDSPGGGVLVLPNARRAVRHGPNVDGAPHMVDVADFQRLNHSALAKWKFLEGPAGSATGPTLILGELAAHPEVADHLANALGLPRQHGWLRQESNSPLGQAARWLVNTSIEINAMVKQTMLSLSPFHIVQEGTHAIGHAVNPFFNIPRIDPDDVGQSDAMAHGLMLGGDEISMRNFMEGLGKAPLIERIPYLGPIARGIADFTFHTYIPGLKYKTYVHILERNLTRFKAAIDAGKTTEARVKYLSARQTNSAYGHLNYKDLGRNPALQKTLLAILLAPDFLEARGRFVLNALQPGKEGAEQRIAMIRLALFFFITARVLNAAANGGDPKWEEPFGLIIDNRKYEMRSVPEDLWKLFKDPRRFIYGRLSPLIGHTSIELLTGKNYRGERAQWTETLADAALRVIPMSIRMAPGLRDLTESTANNPVSPWEQFMGTLGLHISRYSPITDLGRLAGEFAEAQGRLNPGVFPISPYRPLRHALEDNDMARAADELRKLKESGVTDQKLVRGFRQSTFRPWTGETALDQRFLASLRGEDKALAELAHRRRLDIWNRFAKLTGAKHGAVPLVRYPVPSQ